MTNKSYCSYCFESKSALNVIYDLVRIKAALSKWREPDGKERKIKENSNFYRNNAKLLFSLSLTHSLSLSLSLPLSLSLSLSLYLSHSLSLSPSLTHCLSLLSPSFTLSLPLSLTHSHSLSHSLSLSLSLTISLSPSLFFVGGTKNKMWISKQFFFINCFSTSLRNKFRWHIRCCR